MTAGRVPYNLTMESFYGNDEKTFGRRGFQAAGRSLPASAGRGMRAGAHLRKRVEVHFAVCQIGEGTHNTSRPALADMRIRIPNPMTKITMLISCDVENI